MKSALYAMMWLMKFYSTNKNSKPVGFKDALMRGLAEDGGLFMPSELGNFQFPISNFQFWKVLRRFMDIPDSELKKIVKESFKFPVPLVKLDENLYVLELFHGPTLSFKDFGARFMARAMEYYVASSVRRQASSNNLNIVVATSGDTGSAVASGFYGLPNIKVFVLYPSKRISPLQEKQISTLGKNIAALEIKGDFDDCQRLAKQALADQELRKKMNLSSANSINIGRLLPQMSYYFTACEQLSKFPISNFQFPIMVVPSGNFGNITAGLFAKKLGLPIKKFIAAVNKNSWIPEYLNSPNPPSLKLWRARKTQMTYSSAMDVGLPSNWARIRALYDYDHDNNDDKIRKNISKDAEAITISEAETIKTIRDVHEKYGYIADPHTAVGIAATMTRHSSPAIVLATAHPAKFKEIVESAIGKRIPTPESLVELSNKKNESVTISADYEKFREYLFSSALF